MIPFIYHKWYYRVVAGFFLGLAAWLLVEVLLNIRYRYFELFNTPLKYLWAGLLGIFLLEAMIRLNKLFDPKLSWTKTPVRRWVAQTLAGIAVSLLVVSALRITVKMMLAPGTLIIFFDEALIQVVIFFMILALNLAELGYFLVDRYHRSIAEMERFRKENAEHQFEMLRLQLNPHFLFNSLNTLSSLVYEDAPKAAEFIRKLSEVYRYVLDNRDREMVGLEEELDFIRSFTFLLELRFQGMIGFTIDIGDEHLKRRIAPMTLQLLVENAVKHNVASSNKPLNIKIYTEDEFITVINNYQPRENSQGTGVGLKNISSRYRFLTDRAVIIRYDGQNFMVKIPLIK